MSAAGLIHRLAGETSGSDLERELALRAAKGELPFEPSYGRIMFREDPAPEMIGELLIPEEYRQKTCRGVIFGAGCEARDAMRIHGHLVGDRVLYAKFTGVAFPDGRGGTVFLAPVKDILANYDLAERLDKGLMEYRCGPDPTGRETHFVAWTDGGLEKWTKIAAKRKTKESA